MVSPLQVAEKKWFLDVVLLRGASPTLTSSAFAASRAPSVFTQEGTALAHHLGFFHAQRNLNGTELFDEFAVPRLMG